ncbi:CHASE2 domain-containing protein [Pontixanthobacter gangjinensis]|uniref:histidine kinase n=1 Tax=Pontixanthobacter gangjinensis TaxID=1028742 RepID=A0A6I4SL24_9SPHN|nr:CHASE2 domain-containing protein [Pontixanthobacter gangjinensis]MXO56148.1 CHASE2 domain-containing protein [Pontixanthobacter gangjinensis]
MSFKRLILEWAILLACACGLAVLALSAQVTNRMDGRLLDFSTWLANGPVSDDIVIVAIDDYSLNRIGAWPWSRQTHAQLVRELDEAGAQSILFDVLFLEPTEAKADTALANAIRDSGKVILPHTFAAQENSENNVAVAYPLEILRAPALAVGHVYTEPDQDGILRRFDLALQSGDDVFLQFAMAALQAGSADEDDPPGKSAGANVPKRKAIVPFNPAGSYAVIPAANILDSDIPRGFLEGKTIIIGAIAPGLSDRYFVPSGRVEIMSGVETQANLLAAIKQGNLIYEADSRWPLALSLLAILAQFLAFWRLNPRRGLYATVALIIAMLTLSVGLVVAAGVWIPVATAAVVMLLAYPLWSWRRLTTVSEYLDREAGRLPHQLPENTEAGGFDIIAQQVDRMRKLISSVSDSFTFLQQVIELAPDAIIVLDRDGVVQMMNQKADLLFTEWDLADRPAFGEVVLLANAIIDNEKGELTSKDGDVFLMASADFVASDSAKSGQIVALRDISQIRRRETERAEMLEFLSHDMRTPQVAIIGLTKGAASDAVGNDRLRRIRTQAERTLKLADDFVQLARLEEAALYFEDTDLSALAEEACDRAYSLAKKKGITVTQELSEMPVFAWVEASLIARLLDNLLGNAIKYSPGKSVVMLSVREMDDENVVLAVSDEGPGLPTERLADPFARFGAHETKAGPSAGLGLTFVQRTVQKHHGTIEVVSHSTTGTKFSIELPKNAPGELG